MPTLLQCKHCSKEVKVPAYRVPDFKFCSRTCQALAARVEVTSECAICNAQFTHIASRANKAKYCSRGCYYKAMHQKGSIECTCKHCENKFLASPSEKRIYCSKACVNKAKKTIWKPTFGTVRKNMLRRDMLTACERCGFNLHPQILGVHHKDRDRQNNDLSNLEVLCPNCHSVEHAKHLPHGFTE